jgi:hypothetical protein
MSDCFTLDTNGLGLVELMSSVSSFIDMGGKKEPTDNKLPTTLVPTSSLHLLRAGAYFYGETPSEVLQYPPTINSMGFRSTLKVGFSFTCESCKISDKLCNSNSTK